MWILAYKIMKINNKITHRRCVIYKKKKNDENKLTMCIAFATIFTTHYTEGQKGRAYEKKSV